MIKDFKSSEAARDSLAKGIQEVGRLLTGTFGPAGCNVIMDDEYGNLLLSSQTYSILRNLKSKDLFVDEGMQMAKEAALNTERLVGDGTVMTLLFINEMINQGKQMIASGANPVIMARGMKKELPFAEQKIREKAEAFSKESLRQVLQYELSDETLTDIVFNAYEKVGSEGSVIVKEGHGLTTELEYLEGFEVPSGYLSEKMCTNLQKNVKYMYHPYILIVDQVISQFTQLLPILEQVVDAKAGLIIIAEEIKDDALTLITHNVQKKVFDVTVIKAPGVGRRKRDFLEDLAIVTGGNVLDNENPVTLANIKLTDLGRASEVRIEKNRTFFMEGDGSKSAISERIKKINEYIEANETEFMNKNQYRERIGNLEGKIAIIRVGAPTLLQMHEETHRIQSAIDLIRAVTDGGILPGGGSTLAAISASLWEAIQEASETADTADIRNGELLLLEAMKAPARTFIQKGGLGEKESLKRMVDSTGYMGYNVVTKEFTNMKKAGIYDAATVVIAALNQAVSVVYEWLCTEVLMVSVSPDQEDLSLMKKGVPIMR